MPIVSRGDDEDEDETTAAAGAPPAFDVDFDPNDPDQVKVHYNLTGWTFEQRAELAETLAERGVPHVWEGEELVVPEQIEDHVDGIFDELEREIGPFPVPLLDDDDDGEGEGVTEFDLAEWPPADIELLQRSLNEAEIPHRWERRTLVVAHDAEHTVDELLDAIEAGEVASLDEDAEAPDGALERPVRARRPARPRHHRRFVAPHAACAGATALARRTAIRPGHPRLGRDRGQCPGPHRAASTRAPSPRPSPLPPTSCEPSAAPTSDPRGSVPHRRARFEWCPTRSIGSRSRIAS